MKNKNKVVLIMLTPGTLSSYVFLNIVVSPRQNEINMVSSPSEKDPQL
jgi:hypothetical protein